MEFGGHRIDVMGFIEHGMRVSSQPSFTACLVRLPAASVLSLGLPGFHRSIGSW